MLKHLSNKILLLIIIQFIASSSILSQNFTKVTGNVIDSISGETLPFITVSFKGKNIGTTTDLEGNFEITTSWPSKFIVVSSVGYKTITKRVIPGKKQHFNFKLAPAVEQLEVFEVKAKKTKRYRNKENPAVILIRNVIANKDKNRGKEFDFFEFEKYEKDQYDLNNFSKEWTQRKALKSFQVINDYIDTSEINGKPYIPLLIKEKISTIYYRKSPKIEREFVNARRISGFENGSFGDGISQFLEKLSTRVDIYENNIDLLDKSFTSPISLLGPNIYRYYITDSTVIDEKKYKELSFMPRDPAIVAFTGKMWVADSTQYYAVKEIELNVDTRINVNFLNDLRIRQKFKNHPDLGWIIEKDQMIVDIQPSKKGMGVYNTKTVLYRNFKANNPKPEDFYTGINLVVESDSAMSLNSTYWDTARFEKLSEKEMGIYEMVDTIQSIPQFNTLTNIGEFLLSGYIKKGGLDIGPITSFLSYNDVEGLRIRVGGRTNINFHEKWRFEAFLAYGLNDEKWKYKGTIEYYFSKNPRKVFHISHTNDVYQPGFEIDWQEKDNIFLSFRRGNSTNMFYKNEYRAFYEQEWFRGLINRIELSNKSISSSPLNRMFINTENNRELSSIDITEVSISTRFAVNEKFIQGRFKRSTIRTTAPIFRLNYTYSPSTLSDYEFHKLYFSILKRFKLGILGFTDTEIEGAKIFGQVPYILLNIHRGNETFTYDDRSFNLMNFMEFGSDQSISLMMTHHFNGLITSYIPLLDRIKLRAVASGKIVWGSINNENNVNITSSENLIKFPENTLYSLEKEPYAEVSAGVENIFKLLRVEAVKRLTYLNNPKVGTLFGTKGLAIRLKLQISF